MGSMRPYAEAWLHSDLFFLKDSLEHGMSCAEVAGFLCRDEDEGREKARQMKIVGDSTLPICHGARRHAFE